MTDLPRHKTDGEAAAPRLALHSLFGANRHGPDSVLIGYPDMSGLEASDPAALRQRLEAAGLVTGAGDPAAHPCRQAEWVAAEIRRDVGLAPFAAGPGAVPDDAFVLPLEPLVLSERTAALAHEAMRGAPPALLARMLAALRQEHERTTPPRQVVELGRECARRSLPWRRLPWSLAVHQIGEGFRRQRIDVTITDETGRLADGVARNKAEANRLFRHSGIPVPRQETVRRPEEAWSAVQKLQLPVVVKPRSLGKGKGVLTDLRERSEIEEAVGAALAFGPNVVIEEQIVGSDHRVVVADGKVISAIRRVPPSVRGDGTRTIRELVDEENSNPERSSRQVRTLLKTIVIDRELERRIAAQGYNLDSVPPAGAVVPLRYVGNTSQGATAVDVSDEVHPENAEMFVRATRLVGLPLAGFDFISTDISRPYGENGGAICEINTQLAFFGELFAQSRAGAGSISAKLLDAIYKGKGDGRVPVVLVGSAEADRIIREMLPQAGIAAPLATGLVGRDWIGIDSLRLDVAKVTGWHAHQLLTEDRRIALVIMAIDPAEVVEAGLGVRRADLALVGPDWERDAAEAFDIVGRASDEIVTCGDDAMVEAFRSRAGRFRPG